VYWSSWVHWPMLNGTKTPGGSRRRAARYCPDRGGRGPAEQLHVVGAADGEVQPVAELGQRVVGVVEADGQRGQPQQRRRVVVAQQGPPGRVEVGVDDRVEAGVVHQVDQRLRGHRQPGPGAGHAGGLAADRGTGEPGRQRPDPPPGATAAGGRGTGYRAGAGLGEGLAGGDDGGRVPRVERQHLVGGVERDRAQLSGVAGREDLGEPAAIGVPVEVHPAQAQRPQYPGYVTRRVGGVEQVRGVHPAAVAVAPGVVEPVPARRHQPVEGRAVLVLRPAVVLQSGAVHRCRVAGAAEVDQQQAARPHQRSHHRDVLGLGAGGGEARAALDRQHRALRVAGGGGRQPPEPDVNIRAGRRGVIQRHGEAAAVRQRGLRAPA
jgi:hypothetical protein